MGKLHLRARDPRELGGKELLGKQKALLLWLLPRLGFQDLGVLK